MFKFRVFLPAFISLMPATAFAVPMYPGCATPSTAGSHKTFYVDPVKGSMSNDGSQAHPWRTLAEVLTGSSKLVSTQSYNYRTYAKGDKSLIQINPTGPIKPGDTIFLMSGHHGAVWISNYVNSNFITVAAYPGQTPIIDSLLETSSSKWVFSGLKFQGVNPSKPLTVNAIARFGADNYGQTSDIIFTNNTLSTTDDTKSWSNKEWYEKPYYYGALFGGKCATISGNHFYNVMNALAAGATDSLVQGNVFDHFSNDGIDVTVGNVTIDQNTIKDGVNNMSDPLHPDAIQGWTSQGATNNNVVITRNYVQKTGDPKVSYMQGISIFDGAWSNLKVQNNIVITNQYHGIAIFGQKNAEVVNNTVVSSAATYPTWIKVGDNASGKSTNVIVRNNISPWLINAATGGGIAMDHNVATSLIVNEVNGKSVFYAKGVVGTQNRIIPSIYSQLVKVDNANLQYDLRPKATSDAKGQGSLANAPNTDFTGVPRPKPIDLGGLNAVAN